LKNKEFFFSLLENFNIFENNTISCQVAKVNSSSSRRSSSSINGLFFGLPVNQTKETIVESMILDLIPSTPDSFLGGGRRKKEKTTVRKEITK
jgi:hypothetical protein